MAAKEKQEAKLSVDDEFLKSFVERGGKVETPEGQAVDKDNLDQFLKEVGGNESNTPRQAKLHKEAKKRDAADTALEDAEKQQKEAERVEALRKKDQEQRQSAAISAAKQGISAGQNAINPVLQKAGNAVDWASNLKTVGGIGLLVAILIFLLFVVVQVNSQGDTRIKMFWYMLNGRAKLQGRVQVEKQSAGQQVQPSPIDVSGLSGEASVIIGDIANLVGLGLGEGGSLYRGGI